MSRSTVRTKEHIKEAAIHLFSVQGFGGTSIREISEAASVNPALVSYHFKNKQGILENIMVDYFEGLFFILEEQHGSHLQKDCFDMFMSAVEAILSYQCRYVAISAIILRELSVDSMLVREIMSTYMTKLKAYFASLFEMGMEKEEFRLDLHVDWQVIQILSSIFFPYFNPQLIREVFYEEPTSDEFCRQYTRDLSKNWELILKK